MCFSCALNVVATTTEKPKARKTSRKFMKASKLGNRSGPTPLYCTIGSVIGCCNELRFGGNLNLVTLLHDRQRASCYGSNGCAHPGVTSNRPDGRPQTGTPKQASKRAACGAFSLGIKDIGHDGNRDPADHNLCKLEF